MQTIPDTEFHPLLIKTIEESGLTRLEVAEATGYGEGSIRFFQYGKTMPPQRIRSFMLDAIKRAGAEKAKRLASEAEIRSINPDFGWSESETQRRDLLIAGQTCVGSTRRGQDANLIEWAKRRCLVVHVSAPSFWANGYSKRHGDGAYLSKVFERELPNCRGMMSKLHLIKGKLLLCHCHPAPCHGDVLAVAANSIEDATALLPSIQRVRREVSYNAWSGKILWNQAGVHGVSDQAMAGRKQVDGSRLIPIDSTPIESAKIAWAMHYDQWPTAPIEHINGNLDDVRIENLRLTLPD